MTGINLFGDPDEEVREVEQNEEEREHEEALRERARIAGEPAEGSDEGADAEPRAPTA